GGGIIFPRDFCGYVMIPFSSFTLIDGGWKGKDTDGKINLMYLELINFYTGFYQQFKGEMWIDECALYGPTFANVPGAYDVKIDPKNPAARTQSKINIEEKSIEIIDPYGSDDPENNNKSKENTVSQGENSTESDISQEDTLNSDISVDGNGVSALSNEKSDSPAGTTGDEGNNMWWLWIIIGVVVIAGGGVATWYIIKKKNDNDNAFVDDFEEIDNDLEEEISEEENNDNQE
ncbi:MAG: hypothetical protein RR640_05215, partial [Oscillospiraceae bacterium]